MPTASFYISDFWKRKNNHLRFQQLIASMLFNDPTHGAWIAPISALAILFCAFQPRKTAILTPRVILYGDAPTEGRGLHAGSFQLVSTDLAEIDTEVAPLFD